MKLIIAGGRELHPSPRFIDSTIEDFGIDKYKIEELVCGKARGVDTAGEKWASIYQTRIVTKEFPYLSEYGRSGGHIRNKQMAEYADILLLIWDGKSKGSLNMKENMLKLNKPIYEIIIGIKND